MLMDAVVPELKDLVRIEDPLFYIDDPYPIYDRMRVEQPVFYYEPLDIYVLSRYNDIRAAFRQHDVFSSARGTNLSEVMHEHSGLPSPFAGFFDPEGELFAVTDPPRHRELRRLIMPPFLPNAIGKLEEVIVRRTQQLLDEVEPGGVTEFVEMIAAKLPLYVAAALIGVPADDLAQIRRWGDALELAVAGVVTPEEVANAGVEFATMGDFLLEQIKFKRDHPGDDLLTSLIASDIDGHPLSDVRIITNCMAILGASSDTTRSSISGMTLALATHPEQRAMLVSERALMSRAVEESLRWATVTRGFVRTALRDTELSGQTVLAGQRIFALFSAGNFDPEVFSSPMEYDVTRHQEAQQLAFGFGVHACPAAQVVRSTMSRFFNMLLDRFPEFELGGEPVRREDIPRNGWISIPLVFEERRNVVRDG
jgi:cytochrome P450